MALREVEGTSDDNLGTKETPKNSLKYRETPKGNLGR